MHGVCALTGNPVELRYGRTRPFRRLPPLRLVLRSESVPLTAAQVTLAADSLVRVGLRAYLSLLEFTFDVQQFGFSYLERHVTDHRRSVRQFCDQRGRKTVYIGRPRSPWQLRLYQKTDSVTRAEFILRLAFLRSHGIERLEDVLLLAKMKPWDWVWSGSSVPRVLHHMGERLIW
mgnify:FL=1